MREATLGESDLGGARNEALCKGNEGRGGKVATHKTVSTTN